MPRRVVQEVFGGICAVADTTTPLDFFSLFCCRITFVPFSLVIINPFLNLIQDILGNTRKKALAVNPENGSALHPLLSNNFRACAPG